MANQTADRALLRSHIATHGGNLSVAQALFPDAPQPWIDLSTGINPSPYPVAGLPPEAFTRLPGRDEEAALLRAAAQAYGASGETTLVAAPGTQALIQMLPRLHPARTVAVLGPTYGEHAASWRAGGAQAREVARIEDAAGADVLVVVNPNNPDGRATPPDALRAAARHHGLLIVDEAFADLVPEVSLNPGGIPENAVVLRSFGKTYGLAGVRLGFAAGHVAIVQPIADMLGPWAVPGPAIALGTRALADHAWLEETARRLAGDCARLDALLAQAGLRIIGGTPLYRLAETPGPAAPIVEALGAAGILVRPFAYAPARLRFGLPPEWGWGRLADALERVRG